MASGHDKQDTRQESELLSGVFCLVLLCCDAGSEYLQFQNQRDAERMCFSLKNAGCGKENEFFQFL